MSDRPTSTLWDDPGFQGWVAAVEERVADELGYSLANLGDLPLEDAFYAGDTPAEFIAGCVAPVIAALEVAANNMTAA